MMTEYYEEAIDAMNMPYQLGDIAEINGRYWELIEIRYRNHYYHLKWLEVPEFVPPYGVK